MSNYSELVFIIDQSGSMSGKEEDVIGSFNSTIKSQKENGYKTMVTTAVFSDEHSIIHDRLDLKEVKDMAKEDYKPSGCTALIDTIGYMIDHIKKIHHYVDNKPERTLFVIITDGLENASHRYSSNEVKRMIEAQKENKWEFLFLGANIDAVETAKTYGIKEDRAVNFHADKKGLGKVFKAVGEVCSFVLNPDMEDMEVEKKLASGSWRKEADEDFLSR